jgi:cystathionine beta-synthase
VAATAGPEAVVVAVLPDSGRIYLSKYFDDAWLTTLGFLDAPGGPLVRDVIGPYEPGLLVADATTTVAALRSTLDRLDDPPSAVTVVQPRRTSATTWSVPDVLGSLRRDGLAGLVAGDRVGTCAGPPPATVGHGEDAAAARERLGATGPDDPVLVLVDGRAVTQVPRSALG